MKKYIFLFSIILLHSCKTEDIKPIKYSKLERFLIDFKKQHPNSSNNDITNEETSKIFKRELKNLFQNNDSLFYEYPVKFTQIQHSENGYLVKLSLPYDVIPELNKNDLDLDKIKIEILGELKIKDGSVYSLKNDYYYKVVGKFKNYINEGDDYYYLTSKLCDPSIVKVDVLKNTIFHLGCISMDSISIDTSSGIKIPIRGN